MISDRIESINQSCNIFAALIEPQQGLLNIDPAQPVPPSISIDLPLSHGLLPPPPSPPVEFTNEMHLQQPLSDL